MSGLSHAGLGKTDARAAAEDDDFGVHLGQLREVLGAQVLEALGGPGDALAAGSSKITLCVIFSPSTPTHPGP